MYQQLAYLSQSVHPKGHETDENIIAKARARNEQLGVTGYLFRSEHSFLQLLEGPEDAVDAVMSLIRKDPHHQITSEWPKCATDKRAFPEWAMGFGPLTREDVDDMMTPKSDDVLTWSAMVEKMKDLSKA